MPQKERYWLRSTSSFLIINRCIGRNSSTIGLARARSPETADWCQQCCWITADLQNHREANGDPLSNHYFANALLPDIPNYDSPDFRSHYFAMQPELPAVVAGFHRRCFDLPLAPTLYHDERKDGCGWVGIEHRGWGCLCIKRLVTRSHTLGSQRI